MLLKDYLEARGITPYAYAKEMGVSKAQPYHWIENGWVVIGDQLMIPKRKTKPLENQESAPSFLIEMSKRMNSDPNRCTANPFWQVRHKDYLITKEGYNEHHQEICGDDGVILSSERLDDIHIAAEHLKDNYEEWFASTVSEIEENNYCDDSDHGISDIDLFVDHVDLFDDFFELPEGVKRFAVQEVEKTVWTGLTEHGAEAFIARKQHDYPKLYTYVESAYWSPELREFQDWVKSLTKPLGGDSCS